MRSRLEARWAALLDAWHVPWEYEALDLAGFIPDFVMTLGGQSVLLECKPATCDEDIREHQVRVNRSGWGGPALIVGSSLELASDDRCDVVARGCLEVPGRWRRVGRLQWPAAWGPCPFSSSVDLLAAWREAGNTAQWKPPKV